MSKDFSKRSGQSGESLAEAFLLQKGFRVLAKNWHCRVGEIDLIAERDGTIHFVEVKTRRNSTYGLPEEAVTKRKLLHLRRAIHVWQSQTGNMSLPIQADVIAIEAFPNTRPVIRWIENVG